MFPDQIETKAVNRHNLGMMNQGRLDLQMRILRLLRQLLLNSQGDSLPHLCRCRIGKCHDQKLVDIQRMLSFADQLNDSLNQHGSLAASGCR